MNRRSAMVAVGVLGASVTWGIPTVKPEPWVEPRLGWLSGESHEIVNASFVAGEQRKLSELIWDLREVAVGGVSAGFTLEPRVYFRADLWFAFSEGNQTMVDYDWITEDADAPWTDRSFSSTHVLDYQSWDLRMIVDAVTAPKWSIRALIGYRGSHWIGEDYGITTYQYSVNGFRDTEGSFEGPGIRYEQTLHAPYIGASGELQAGGWAFSAYLLYGPWVFGSDVDDHFLRDMRFESELDGGTLWALGASGRYDFRGGLFVTAGVDYQLLQDATGDLISRNQATGQGAILAGGAEASLETLTLWGGIGYAF